MLFFVLYIRYRQRMGSVCVVVTVYRGEAHKARQFVSSPLMYASESSGSDVARWLLEVLPSTLGVVEQKKTGHPGTTKIERGVQGQFTVYYSPPGYSLMRKRSLSIARVFPG